MPPAFQTEDVRAKPMAARSGKRSRTAGSYKPKSSPAEPVADERRRGRGAVSNPSGRFEAEVREDVDDGWGALGELPAFRTLVTVERPKKIITRNESPDISFDRSINPYRGCEHGCVYCFARPTHAYMGLSPGLDFETRLFAKEGAAELLERELSAADYQPKTIAIGTNTDPYQPIEKQYRIMRSVLEVLARFDHPVGIVTKSALVTRDIDLLAPMAEKGLAKVALSVTTLDRKLARTMEPRASSPDRRLEAIRQLAEAGIPTSVMVAPIIPAITDPEIETILTRAHAMGAREAGYVMLRLPLEVEDLFGEWLLANYRPLPPRHRACPRDAWRQGLRFELGQTNDGRGSLRLDDRAKVRNRLRGLGFNVQRRNLRPIFSTGRRGRGSKFRCSDFPSRVHFRKEFSSCRFFRAFQTDAWRGHVARAVIFYEKLGWRSSVRPVRAGGRGSGSTLSSSRWCVRLARGTALGRGASTDIPLAAFAQFHGSAGAVDRALNTDLAAGATSVDAGADQGCGYDACLQTRTGTYGDRVDPAFPLGPDGTIGLPPD